MGDAWIPTIAERKRMERDVNETIIDRVREFVKRRPKTKTTSEQRARKMAG